MRLEKALEIAAHVTNPVAVVTVALILLVFYGYTFFRRSKKTHSSWLLALPLVLLILLALAPLISSTLIKSKGVYRVRIVVRSPDQQVVTDVSLTSSIGGEIEKADGTWELIIPPQVRPSDRKVTIYASRDNAYQTGRTDIELGDDYYLKAIVQLTSLPSSTVRGIVKDEFGKSVRQAHISIVGYPDIATTNEMGNFELSAHVAEGQMISVHAEKESLVADRVVAAGVPIELIVRRR